MTPNRKTAWAAALFASIACLVSCDKGTESSGDPGRPPARFEGMPTLAGTWVFAEHNEAISSYCAEDSGTSSEETITITQDSTVLTMTGFLGVSTNVATGWLHAPTESGDLAYVQWFGSHPEDAGTTTVLKGSILRVKSATSMEGAEVWQWKGGAGSCTGQESVVATKNVAIPY